MAEKSASMVQREAAAVVLLGVALIVPLACLASARLWGRVPSVAVPEGNTPAGAGPDAEPLPPTVWTRPLVQDERDWLMGAFFSNLTALREGRVPRVDEGPGQCMAPLNAPLVVTLYPKPGMPMRFEARAPSLADAVGQAARQAVMAAAGRGDESDMRVQMTVLREMLPMSREDRASFVRREFGRPEGLVIIGEASQAMLLPADAAAALNVAYRSGYSEAQGLNAEMMELVCQGAGLPRGAWMHAGRYPMALVRADTFVNVPGSTDRTLPCPRGIVPGLAASAERMREAGVLAGTYLRNMQRPDGSYAMFDASGLVYGCDSIVLQTATAEALAHVGAMAPQVRRHADVALKGVAYAMVGEVHEMADTGAAWIGREETCRDVLELEATAQTLAALCRHKMAVQDDRSDADILSLANFLLVMQEDDGDFVLRYSDMSGPYTPPKFRGAIVPRARAIYALCLAYDALSVPEALLAARRGMAAFGPLVREQSDTMNAEEAGWLARAVLQYSRCDIANLAEPLEVLVEVARRRRALQIGEDAAPAADMVGASVEDYPPRTASTAQDAVLFSVAASLSPEDALQNREAALRAAGFVLGMQFTPENGYLYADAERRMGAFRRSCDSKLVALEGVAAALNALAVLLDTETYTGED